MTELQFEDAAPVKRPFSGGRQAAPNPYAGVINAIALKVYTEDNAPSKDAIGQPVAKSFLMTHENADTVQTDRNRFVRQSGEAGKNNDPRVTVRAHFDDANTERQPAPGKPKETVYQTRVTFWTVAPYRAKTGAVAPAESGRDSNGFPTGMVAE